MPDEFIVAMNDAGQRLDVFCVTRLPGFSRATIQKAIKEGGVKVNGKVVKPRCLVKTGEVIDIEIDLNSNAPAPSISPSGRGSTEIQLPIIYEDKDVAVVNKPAGVLVHPTGHSDEPTVAGWLAERYGQSQNPPLSALARGDAGNGIVHRLDRDTSGVLILAKNPEAQGYLANQFKAHRVKKEYLALVFGVPNMKEGRITQAIIRSRTNPARRTVVPPKEKSILAGKPAITEWRLDKNYGVKYSLLSVYPLTGRTHQIRVHLHFIGYPIVGDHLYTFKRQKPPAGVKRQMLHAEKLKIALPNGKTKVFIAELPQDFKDVICAINPKSKAQMSSLR